MNVMDNCVQFWATVLSPVVGMAAIIVALIISHRSTKKAQQQIDAIYKLQGIFVASQTPTIIDAQRKYEQELDKIEELIEEAENEIQIVNPFAFQGARINMIEEMERKREQNDDLEALKKKRQEIKDNLSLIQAYIDRTK